MADPRDRALDREARAFALALVGSPADDYVLAQYRRAHASALPLAPAAGFDTRLVNVAARHPLLARAADAYARRFVPRATLRRKLTLLLAILESRSPSDAAFAPRAASPAGVVLRLGGIGLAAVAFTLAGIVLCAPLHLLRHPGDR